MLTRAERWSRDLVGATVAALLPGRCLGCGAAAEPVCPTCAAGLRPPPRLAVPAGLDGWVAPFAYVGVARELIARIKYRNDRAAVPWLATHMVRALRTDVTVDVVTWVPGSGARRRGSGFDHGELLARAVGRRLDRPVVGLIIREPGPPQTGLSRAQRGPGPALRASASARAGVAGRSVLLVDDVATTGATLAAAASVLRRAGAGAVVALTAAATPGGGR